MMIRKLREHFPARTPEWSNSLTLFAWGAYVLLHPGMFQREYFAGLQAMGAHYSSSPERLWGLVTITVGLTRACALFINGAHSRTPLLRLVTAAISAFVWSQVILGVLATGLPALGVVMYSSALLLDLISAYRASCDMVIADAGRNAERRARGLSGASSSGGVHSSVRAATG